MTRTFFASVVMALITPICAHGQSEEKAAALEKMLTHYARSAGVLARCFEGPGEAGITHQAERIAAWRYPGALASITGERAEYLERLVSNAELQFLTTRLEDICPGGIFVGSYEMMVESASKTIEHYTTE